MYQIKVDRSGKVWTNKPNLISGEVMVPGFRQVKVQDGFLLSHKGNDVIAKPGQWRVRPDLPEHFIRVGIK